MAKRPMVLVDGPPKEPMKSVIYHKRYECPYCGFMLGKMFPIERYQAGSHGTRTFKCTNCGKEMAE